MRATISLCVAIHFGLFGVAANAGSRSLGQFVAHVESHVPTLLAKEGAAGLAVATVEDGKTVYLGGFGFANKEAGTPVTADTIFNMASVSKAVSALGVLRLIHERGISLDGAVLPVFPKWQFPDPNADTSQVTFRRVLGHRAGLSMPSVPWFFPPARVPSLTEILKDGSADVERLYIKYPANEFNYSGGGYAMLQLLVEQLTGESFDAYMRSRIFKPLGMSVTTFDQKADVKRAVGYDEDGKPIGHYEIVGSAAGGLYSSAADFAHVVHLYMPSGSDRDNVISPEQLLQISANTVPVRYAGVDPKVFGGAKYGLGHGVHITKRQELLLYHSGGNPGFIAYFIVAPNTGRGLVMMANSANARSAMEDVRRAWADQYGYDLPEFY
ncbi:MAG: beta-lactamase family protein [Alphaproteobacteria bacterium]|nr:beta-lactamase family protein [Alphaproteobacteria bacterium]